MRCLCLVVDHLLCVTVVGTDEENAVHLLYCLYRSAYALVDPLNCCNCCLDNTCMTYHVRVSEVDDDDIVIVRCDSCVELLGYFGSAHLRLKVVCSNLGGVNKCTILVLVGLLDTAVEEESNVSVLLCLSETKLLQTVSCKILTECVCDLFLLECDELVGDRLIVILEAYVCKGHEAVSSLKELDALGICCIALSCCDIGISKAESLCYLTCTVGTEVEEDNGVVRLNN